MNKISNQTQDKQLTTFVTLGLVFGALGVHDFYIGKESQGFLHLLFPIVFLIFSYFFPVFLVADDGHFWSNTAKISYHVIMWLPLIIFIISWIWAIKEVADYAKNSKVANKKASLKVAFSISAILFAIIVGIALGFIFGFPTFLIN